MFDAIVVGAGPAGATAALVMAGAGARVLVVDRAVRPRAGGSGLLSTSARTMLATLGVSVPPASHHVRACPVTSARTGRSRLVELDATIVARDRLDEAIVASAAAAGARIERGWFVRRPLVAERAIVRGVDMRRGAMRLRIPALVVVAADGARSSLVRAAGLAAGTVRHRTWSTLLDTPDRPATAELFLGRRGWCRLLPADGGVRFVLSTPQTIAPRDALTAARALGPVLARRLDGSRVIEPWHRTRARTVSRAGVPGLLLAGDAAGVGSAAGDGIAAAIAGGLLAARVALRTIETGSLDGSLDELAAARAMWIDPALDVGRRLDRLIGADDVVSMALAVAGVARRRAEELVRHWAAWPGRLESLVHRGAMMDVPRT